jgi:hypothetical protein
VEIYAHLSRGTLPVCADSVAAIRVEGIDEIRELVIDQDERTRIWEQARTEAKVEVEVQRLAAIELGRQRGRSEWAQTVIDLAAAVELTGQDRTLELHRLAPMLIEARTQVRFGRF